LACVAAIGYGIYRDRLLCFKQKQGIYLLLLPLLALPMVAYHLNALNMISLYKHMVYANLFLLIAAAWLFEELLQSGSSVLKQLFLVALIGVYVVLNYQQLKQAERAFADVSPVIAAVQSRLQPETTILSEDPYLFRYLGFESTPQGHIKESNWLDNNRDGVYEKKDVVEAIWDAKFSYIYLNDQLHPTLNKTIRKLLKTRGYQPIFESRYNTSEVMSRQKKGVLGLYERTRKPSVALQDDDLFDRGKALQAFIKGGSSE